MVTRYVDQRQRRCVNSSTVADSVAYDKHKSGRVVESAMKVADAFANLFALE